MAKVEKLQKRFGIVFNDQNYYEAHQVARTIYYRWLELSEYERLSSFLYEKISEFARVNEPMIALDLADLYVKTISQAAFPVDHTRLSQIETIFNVIPRGLQLDVDTKTSKNPLASVVNQFINWSAQMPSASMIEKQYGDARLNLIFAQAFEAVGFLDAAKKHYICSKDPENYARFISEHIEDLVQAPADKNSDEELPSLDDDLLMGLCVLQVLAIGRLGVATKLLHLLTEKIFKYAVHPPYNSPVLNFVWLLLFSIQLRSMEYFTELVETYKPTLTRDSKLIMFVDKVGQRFFGVPSKDENYGGLLGSLLQGMVSKRDVKLDNPNDFEPDDREFLAQYKITDQSFHAACEAALARNPPGACAELHYSDALDEPLDKKPQPSSASQSSDQQEMDLD